ncbi:MAG: hypothetical protein AAF483_30745, partial [Planctomycetota bacterium]
DIKIGNNDRESPGWNWFLRGVFPIGVLFVLVSLRSWQGGKKPFRSNSHFCSINPGAKLEQISIWDQYCAA